MSEDRGEQMCLRFEISRWDEGSLDASKPCGAGHTAQPSAQVIPFLSIKRSCQTAVAKSNACSEESSLLQKALNSVRLF